MEKTYTDDNYLDNYSDDNRHVFSYFVDLKRRGHPDGRVPPVLLCYGIVSDVLCSVEEQKRIMDCWVQKHISEYEDPLVVVVIEPATTRPRKRYLNRFLKLLSEGDVFISTEISTFSRNVTEFCETFQLLNRKKVRLVLKKPRIDTSQNGEFCNIVLEQAIYFSDMDKQNVYNRTMNGLKVIKEQKMRRGRPYGSQDQFVLSKKTEIVDLFCNKSMNISQIARFLGFQNRTIRKLLLNEGLIEEKEILINSKEGYKIVKRAVRTKRELVCSTYSSESIREGLAKLTPHNPIQGANNEKEIMQTGKKHTSTRS